MLYTICCENDLGGVDSSVVCGDKLYLIDTSTVELQWLEHLWNHENIFETGVV